ncbi:MAG: prolyl oligopeptidase family protein [Mangrovibacterium sp.]
MAVLMYSCAEQAVQYPGTKKEDVRDDYFGTMVEDPYRWLENDTSEETAAWVNAQNEVTFAYLNSLPRRDEIRRQLTELMDYPKHGTPFKKAGKYFFFKNDGLQNQSVLYQTDSLDGEARVLLDPNTLSEDGTVALTGIELSEDAKYLVYKIARSGSDWNEVFVKEVEHGKLLEDHLVWVKFSELAWYNRGFFYSAYDRPEKGRELSGSNEFQRVYYHKLGTSQDDDMLIAGDPDNPKRMFGVQITDDKRFLALMITESTNGNALSVRDLKSGKKDFIPLMEGFEHEFYLIDNLGDDLYVWTNYKAPRYRLVKININRPKEANWTEIIPEGEDVLQSVDFVGGKIVAGYMKDARSQVEVYALDGNHDHTVSLPGLGSVGSFSGEKDDPVAFFGYTSFNTPGEIFRYNVNTRESELWFRPEVRFNPDDYVVRQAFYPSKDGTRIPLFVVHKKGVERDGHNPALLYGYGGFNISLTPSFSPARMVFLENGGVLAVANTRGGGEYGEAWHEAGTKLNKQNVFDDFIAAAEYMIETGYTNSNKLAIQGGSNGGLLVGAVTNQRPELFRVALPAVGVMDMLRFHRFTIGWAWAGDYGTSADSREMFAYLYGYSPYHNIRPGVEYPAVLVTTADHDDRVVPAHSFKYIARLQEFQSGSRPVLIRIDTKAGHGGGKPTAKIIDEYTDLWSFVFSHLGMKS